MAHIPKKRIGEYNFAELDFPNLNDLDTDIVKNRIIKVTKLRDEIANIKTEMTTEVDRMENAKKAYIAQKQTLIQTKKDEIITLKEQYDLSRYPSE